MSNIDWCIDYLKEINNINEDISLKKEDALRALMNITMPYDLSDEFYSKQDEALLEIRNKRELIDVESLPFIKNKISLFKGDITLLKADAIVNACNEKLLGCFVPLHGCIDNAIHSYAGLEVRRDLLKIMNEQGHDEPNGKAKITKGYNLPSKFIIHTVGPKVFGRVTHDNEMDLYNCYISSLRIADECRLQSIVFCSISTGIYGYPFNKAIKVALRAVNYYLENENKNLKRIVFDVFKESEYEEYYRAIKEEN